MTEKKTYTPQEVADILQITRRTVYEYIKLGKIKAVKIGKGHRISSEQLDKIINQGIN